MMTDDKGNARFFAHWDKILNQKDWLSTVYPRVASDTFACMVSSKKITNFKLVVFQHLHLDGKNGGATNTFLHNGYIIFQ